MASNVPEKNLKNTRTQRGTVSVVGQEITIDFLACHMVRNKLVYVNHGLTKLLGSPIWETEISAILALAKIAQNFENKINGLTILGALGRYFEDESDIAFVKTKNIADLATLLLYQRLCHQMYEKASELILAIESGQADYLIKDIKEHKKQFEESTLLFLANAIVWVAAETIPADSQCQNILSNLVMVTNNCPCDLCDTLAMGTARRLKIASNTQSDLK
jgi:hypothetical protein